MPSKIKLAGIAAREMLGVLHSIDGPVKRELVEHNIHCRPGCCHCCYQYAIITLPEALVLAQHVLTSRTSQQMERLHDGIALAITRTPERVNRASYFDGTHPCVLLSSSGLCSTYDARPAACRYYFALCTPDKCHHTSRELVAYLDMKEVELSVLHAAYSITAHAGLPIGVAPLPVGLWWALLLLEQGADKFHAELAHPHPSRMFGTRVDDIVDAHLAAGTGLTTEAR